MGHEEPDNGGVGREGDRSALRDIEVPFFFLLNRGLTTSLNFSRAFVVGRIGGGGGGGP